MKRETSETSRMADAEREVLVGEVLFGLGRRAGRANPTLTAGAGE